MSKDEALRDLIERVEAAQGPDRELDRDIMIVVVPCDRARFRYWAPVNEDTGYGVIDVERVYYAPHCAQAVAVPQFTASIDAAMTLVPEGWRFGIEQAGAYDGSSRDEAWCWPYESNFDPDWQNGQQGYRDAPDGARGYAATPALALVAACLRAHMGTGG